MRRAYGRAPPPSAATRAREPDRRSPADRGLRGNHRAQCLAHRPYRRVPAGPAPVRRAGPTPDRQPLRGDTRAVERALADLAGRPDPGTAGVLAHFTRLAQTTPVPLIVYHVPRRTGCSPGVDCLWAVLELPGVIGMKPSPEVIDEETVRLMGDIPSGRSILVGDDALLQPLVAMGAGGGATASAHLATDRFVEFLASAVAGVDPARTRVLGHALAALSSALFREPNPTVIKGVLRARGRIPTADVRLPPLPAHRASVEHAEQLLTEPRPSGVPDGPVTGRRPDAPRCRPGGRTTEEDRPHSVGR
ncbi:dihydrodipicolinate synthase family protein [Streptomyces sp. ST2-7A]|uniref:dihydrodipicolinate synthase family protein n=1 Tax=Streptomyces sp. ST2-7A TaxID=2907214 RepID=UPI001F314E1A|nr:dihydrodipicolinate synthase family protein [Streptomyces sp. ST2-7A]MCE7079452.1 dihydrodipicolinate synthase family protein [Streptomyces sp. ST2-7A]